MLEYEVEFKTKKARNDMRSILTKMYSLKNRDLEVDDRYDVVLKPSKVGDYNSGMFTVEARHLKFYYVTLSVDIFNSFGHCEEVKSIILTGDFLDTIKDNSECSVGIKPLNDGEGTYVFATDVGEVVLTERRHTQMATDQNIWQKRLYSNNKEGVSTKGTVKKFKSSLDEDNSIVLEGSDNPIKFPSNIVNIMSADTELKYEFRTSDNGESRVFVTNFSINQFSSINIFIMRVYG